MRIPTERMQTLYEDAVARLTVNKIAMKKLAKEIERDEFAAAYWLGRVRDRESEVSNV